MTRWLVGDTFLSVKDVIVLYRLVTKLNQNIVNIGDGSALIVDELASERPNGALFRAF